FQQTGGTNSAGTYLRVGERPGHVGTYEFSGGVLWADELWVGWRGTSHQAGLFRQMGGTNLADYLHVDRDGRYEFLGGTLHVSSGLNISGKLDCAGQPVSISVEGGSLVNLTGGYILRGGHATLTVGEDSLTIYDRGLPRMALPCILVLIGVNFPRTHGKVFTNLVLRLRIARVSDTCDNVFDLPWPISR
ncbi:MAG: hypothetical protein QF577_09990, partial [Phycisphaerae bacterium]|nr:hypothetical protein [Phycisphaerae bacterium]